MNKKEQNKFDDIINLPYLKSKKHPPMSAVERAAQFLPFAALTGYDAEIKEMARLTDKRIILSEEVILSLNMQLAFLNANIKNHPLVEIRYFNEDEMKSGGSYIRTQGVVKKIDEIESLIIMEDKTTIPLDDIIEINFK